MKTVNLDVSSLEKCRDNQQTESVPKNLKQIRRKLVLQRKFKSFEPDFTPFQTKQNSPSKNIQEKLILDHKDFKQAKIAIQKKIIDENYKQTRSSIKLPNINHRNVQKLSAQNLDISPYEGTADSAGTNDHVIEKMQANMANNIKRKSISRDNQVNQIEQRSDNFMKYMQIKSMKPTQKVIQPKADLSIRELRPMKMQRFVSNKLKAKQDYSLTKVQLKKSEKTIKIKRSQLKSEKSISTHSANKQKKSMSISKPLRKKVLITNSYWDFCHFMCLLHKIETPSIPVGTYKAYIGKGNNSILIKNSLKNRFWWNIVDQSMDVNLYWSQLRDNKFVQSLKSLPQTKNDQIQQSLSSQKPIIFNLPKDGNNDKSQFFKDLTGTGLHKYMSNDQKKRYTKHSHNAQIIKQKDYRKIGNPHKNRMHNHLQYFWHLSNKKALFYNMKKYYEAINDDPFKYLPLTFHVQKYDDNQWERFIAHYQQKQQQLKKKYSQSKNKKKKQKNLWIVKPGQNSNQGCGIQVYDSIQEIAQMVKNTERSNGRQRSYIIQKYLMPFLYNKRKFDIRTYVLFTSINGIYKAYWYEQGYIRTSCKQFTIKNLKNRLIHLTNDAIQKKSEDYGKYENGNKLSYTDFQKYLDQNYPDKQYDFYSTVYPAMIKRATDAMKSACMLLDPNKRQFTFQIFGLDFMIDDNFDTWLIQVNTNPCLDLGSPLLARVIPNMIQNALKIAVDPLFPPPKQFPKTKSVPNDVFESNKFNLIFNSHEQQEILINLTKDTNLSNIVESDEEQQVHEDQCEV